MNESSCVGCKFLYQIDIGYSNYTVLDTEVRCAKNRNPHLPEEIPENWDMENDHWSMTDRSRCELYVSGPVVWLDVDGDDGPADFTDDREAIEAICADSGRAPHGSA